ncbi:MAG: hypothetical protein ACQEQ0_09900 [Bacteroidota bacterium]
MKKILFILMGISFSTILYAQGVERTVPFRNPINHKYYNSNSDAPCENVQTLQQFIFNVAASYQMYADIKMEEDKFLKPGILLNNKPIPTDSLSTISMDDIKKMEFRTGEGVKAIFPSMAYSGVFFIETK